MSGLTTKEIKPEIIGGEETPYSGGVFKLEIQIPERYPFEPPKVRFITPIYHPNIDNGGRICLDMLKMPPKGAWKPCLNIGTVLTSLQLLMAEPNPEDPLMTDISNEFKYNRTLYNVRAKEWTQKYAMETTSVGAPMETSDEKEDTQNTSEKHFSDKNSDTEKGTKRGHVMADLTNKRLKPS